MADFYQLTPSEQEDRYRQLAELVLPRWGREDASLDLIKMRENAVFKVTDAQGNREVLRIHRANYHSNDELRSELQWMQALAVAGVETPEVIPTLDGELAIVPESDLAGAPRQIDMFAWVDGEQLGSVEDGLEGDLDVQLENFVTIGALAARVHNQSCDWVMPEGFVRHAWDSEGLAGEQPFWGRFWELEALNPQQKKLINRVRDCLREELKACRQDPQTYGLIHADMVPENVLIDGSHVRLIDFDDAGFGWHLFEMATSLFFAAADGNFEALRDAFTRGYRSQRELRDADLEKLPLFMLARASTYLGWIHTRSETETARELTPMIVELVCATAEDYFAARD